MLQARLEIINKLGLHARAASKFVSCTSRFGSRIRVARDGQEVDGKSIMAVMMLAAGKGSVLEITIDGADEKQALAALEALVGDRFGEGE